MRHDVINAIITARRSNEVSSRMHHSLPSSREQEHQDHHDSKTIISSKTESRAQTSPIQEMHHSMTVVY